MSELPNCLKFRSANAKDLRCYCRLSEVGSATTVKCLSPSNSDSPWEWGRNKHFKRGLFLDKNNLFPRYLSYQRSLPVHDSRPRESLSVQDAYSEIVHPTYARQQTPESISQSPYPVQRLPTHSLV